MSLKVKGQEPGKAVSLSATETMIPLDVTAVDGVSKDCYVFYAQKPKFPVAPNIEDFKKNVTEKSLSCEICSNILYCPKVTKGTKSKHPYCIHCLGFLKLKKECPFEGIKFPDKEAWSETEENLEQGVSGVVVNCPFSFFGCDQKLTLKEMFAHIRSCEKKASLCSACSTYQLASALEDHAKDCTSSCDKCGRKVARGELEAHKKETCTSIFTGKGIGSHIVSCRPWEKNLILVKDLQKKSYDEQIKEGERLEKEYMKYSITSGGKRSEVDVNGAIMAVTESAKAYATAISMKEKDPGSHFKLAVALEESFLLKEMYEKKRKTISKKKKVQGDSFLNDEDDDIDDGDQAGSNESAVDSSNADEIAAILKQSGITVGSSVEAKLKALDQEYHKQKEAGQWGKAEYLQQLYAWQMKQSVKAFHDAVDKESGESSCNLLKQASLKYMDALKFDKDNSEFNFHVARTQFHLLKGGKDKDVLSMDECIDLLKTAKSLRPIYPACDLYLGLTLLEKDILGASKLVESSYKHFFFKRILELGSDIPALLLSTNTFNATNGQLLNGLLEYASCLRAQKKYAQAVNVVRDVSWIITVPMNSIIEGTDLYAEFESVLLRCQLEMCRCAWDQRETDPSLPKVLMEDIHRLANKVYYSESPSFLDTLETICQFGVIMYPRDPKVLFQLGNAQLLQLDKNEKFRDDVEKLRDAEYCFETSLKLESSGKEDSTGDFFEALPDGVKDQSWVEVWKSRLERETKIFNSGKCFFLNNMQYIFLV